MKTIDLAALATVTGGAGFFDRFKAPPRTVVSAPGGIAVGGNLVGSTITIDGGANGPGIAVGGDLKGVNIINGKIVPATR